MDYPYSTCRAGQHMYENAKTSLCMCGAISRAPKPSDSEVRKSSPVFSGVMQYFPDALKVVSQHSKRGNDKHNPGQPMHWAKEKSTDHADCLARHLIDIGPNWDGIDPETGSYHAAALAWRALALLQTVIERKENKK